MKAILILILAIFISTASCGLLEKLSKSKLVNLTIQTEEYLRNILPLTVVGSLDNYAHLPKHDLIEKIYNYISLGGEEVRIFVNNQTESLLELTYKYPIREFLSNYSKEELLSIASQLETHIRLEHNFFGGLHDYAESLNNEELVDEIMKFANTWGEYRAVIVSIAAKINANHLIKAFKNVSAGFLKNFALSLENYSKKLARKEQLFGGVHDVIARTEDVEILNSIIQNQIENISKYDETIYAKLSSVEFIEHLLNSSIMNQKDLAKYLGTKSIKELMQLALKAESVYRKEKNLENLLGGLHDYINSLTSDILIDYILSKACILPLIATEKFLDN